MWNVKAMIRMYDFKTRIMLVFRSIGMKGWNIFVRCSLDGLEQGVNLLLKLKNEVWDEDLNDLESEMAVDLTKKIIQSVS